MAFIIISTCKTSLTEFFLSLQYLTMHFEALMRFSNALAVCLICILSLFLAFAFGGKIPYFVTLKIVVECFGRILFQNLTLTFVKQRYSWDRSVWKFRVCQGCCRQTIVMSGTWFRTVIPFLFKVCGYYLNCHIIFQLLFLLTVLGLLFSQATCYAWNSFVEISLRQPR